jgi:hypothetical protein
MRGDLSAAASNITSSIMVLRAKAYVKRVEVDYYTDAVRYTQVRVLQVAGGTDVREDESCVSHWRSHGDALVRSAGGDSRK